MISKRAGDWESEGILCVGKMGCWESEDILCIGKMGCWGEQREVAGCFF